MMWLHTLGRDSITVYSCRSSMHGIVLVLVVLLLSPVSSGTLQHTTPPCTTCENVPLHEQQVACSHVYELVDAALELETDICGRFEDTGGQACSELLLATGNKTRLLCGSMDMVRAYDRLKSAGDENRAAENTHYQNLLKHDGGVLSSLCNKAEGAIVPIGENSDDEFNICYLLAAIVAAGFNTSEAIPKDGHHSRVSPDAVCPAYAHNDYLLLLTNECQSCTAAKPTPLCAEVCDLFASNVQRTLGCELLGAAATLYADEVNLNSLHMQDVFAYSPRLTAECVSRAGQAPSGPCLFAFWLLRAVSRCGGPCQEFRSEVQSFQSSVQTTSSPVLASVYKSLVGAAQDYQQRGCCNWSYDMNVVALEFLIHPKNLTWLMEYFVEQDDSRLSMCHRLCVPLPEARPGSLVRCPYNVFTLCGKLTGLIYAMTQDKSNITFAATARVKTPELKDANQSTTHTSNKVNATPTAAAATTLAPQVTTDETANNTANSTANCTANSTANSTANCTISANSEHESDEALGETARDDDTDNRPTEPEFSHPTYKFAIALVAMVLLVAGLALFTYRDKWGPHVCGHEPARHAPDREHLLGLPKIE